MTAFSCVKEKQQLPFHPKSITELTANMEGDYIYYGEIVMSNCKKECIKDCISIDKVDKMSDEMKYIAYERDRSDVKSSLKVGIDGLSGSISYNPKDDFLGEEQIYYCDKIYPESNVYNFGSFRFGLTESTY